MIIYSEIYLEYIDKYIKDIFNLLEKFECSSKEDLKLEIEHSTIGSDKFSSVKYMNASNSINVRIDINALHDDISFRYLIFQIFHKMVYAFKFASFLPDIDSVVDHEEICRVSKLIDIQADCFIDLYAKKIIKDIGIFNVDEYCRSICTHRDLKNGNSTLVRTEDGVFTCTRCGASFTSNVEPPV